jgi:hypothetical protein
MKFSKLHQTKVLYHTLRLVYLLSLNSKYSLTSSTPRKFSAPLVLEGGRVTKSLQLSIDLSFINPSSIYHQSIIYLSSIYHQSIYHLSISSINQSIYIYIYLSSIHHLTLSIICLFIYLYHLSIINLSSIYHLFIIINKHLRCNFYSFKRVRSNRFCTVFFINLSNINVTSPVSHLTQIFHHTCFPVSLFPHSVVLRDSMCWCEYTCS